jgi:hypothetical protein
MIQARQFDSDFPGLTSEDTRDAGMAKAEHTAEERHPGWKDEAVEFVRRFALTHKHFHCEEVAAFAAREGFTAPASPRAWGPVMMKAATLRYVVSKGLVKKKSARSHQTPAVLWESLLCEEPVAA